MRPHDQPATGERGQVGPHRDFGHAKQILELGDQGVAALSLVMHEGRMTGIVDRKDATQVRIMELASQ